MAELPKYFYLVPKVDGLTITIEDRSDRDVVEIVRCKDCKWFNDMGCAIRIVDDSDKPKDNDYCSFGELKDEVEHG